MTNTKHKPWLEDALTKRRAFAADPHRPVCHLVPPAGWLNDPNGVIEWRGEYHLFYQHNPLEARWGPPHWGHVVSRDLVHWCDRPVALTPEMEPIDAGGCWSGCAVDDNGIPTLIYTGVEDDHLGEQTTCLAFGDDTLTHWRKFEGNPVLRTPDNLGITRKSYRDPYVWKENGVWYQVVGTSIGGRGQALLYRSRDLRRWDYLDVLIPQAVRDTFDDVCHTWECVNFFALGEQHVLIVSLAADEALSYPVAFVGAFREGQFYPETMQRVDWGYACFYAPLSFEDSRGRRLMWGWLQEQRPIDAQLEAGWSGAMSLPRVLSLENGHLIQQPVMELEQLRTSRTQVAAQQKVSMPHRACELKLSARTSGDLYIADGKGTPLAFLNFDAANNLLSLRPVVPPLERAYPWSCPLEASAETLELHLYLDGSTVELFANGQALSARLYPAATGFRLEWRGDLKALRSFEVWGLEGIY